MLDNASECVPCGEERDDDDDDDGDDDVNDDDDDDDDWQRDEKLQHLKTHICRSD